MPAALSVAPYNSLNSNFRRSALLPLVVDIGGSGAPTVNTTLSPNGFTVSRSTNGTYSVTMPSGARAVVFGQPSIRYATQLAGANQRPSLVSVGTIDPVSGTFGFVTASLTGDTEGDYTVADLASGDQVTIVLLVEGG